MLFAIEIDAGVLTAAGVIFAALCAAIGAAGKYLLQYRRDGQKTEVTGLWQIINALRTSGAEMKETFDKLVNELNIERQGHADCRVGYGELYQVCAMQHGILVEVVKGGPNPGRYIPDMPPRREESPRRDEERRAIDKAVKEVKQNGMLLDAQAGELTKSVFPSPPNNGGKP